MNLDITQSIRFARVLIKQKNVTQFNSLPKRNLKSSIYIYNFTPVKNFRRRTDEN